MGSQWNSFLNRLSSAGAHLEALLSYSSMLREGTAPDAYTFPSLLKSCASLASLPHALSVHQHTLVHGYASNARIASSLIHAYAKCRDILSARQVFDRMPQRDVVPWTAIISCYSHLGDSEKAFSMYNQMRHQRIQPNSVTVLGLLLGISDLSHLQCVQACVVRLGFGDDLVVVNSMLNVYGRCRCVEAARKLFHTMSYQDIVSWNCLLSAYSVVRDLKELVDLFNRMRMGNIKPDQKTFGCMVSAVAENSCIELGKLVHAQVITSGLESNLCLKTSLMSMYLKLSYVDEASQLFDKIGDKDCISWTAMISGLVQNERSDEALNIFRKMLMLGTMPSIATIASILAACAQLISFNHGASIHGYIIRQRISVDIAAQNSLITMYAKCGHLIQCQALFDRMNDRDVVSWNAIVTGYAQHGHLNKALLLFNEMRMARQGPNSITVVSLLQACASMGAFIQGKSVHNFLLRIGMKPSISVDTELVDMYSKCGDIKTAQRCFNGMFEKDVVAWSAIIAGYGAHGKGEAALRMYSDFLQTRIKPNHVLFLSVLAACSHAGLVSEGLTVYQSMTEDFRIEPKLEHNACIVDLLSRAGRTEEAYRFNRMMQTQPSVDILGILLNACRIHGNTDLGEVITREILSLKPVNAWNFVQLAHSYAAMCRWNSVGEMWTQMRSLGLRKVPGWSSIELHGTITIFYVDHSSHPQYDEIMLILMILYNEMKDKEQRFQALLMSM